MRTSLSIDARKTALVCVDLQEEHRHDKRYLVDGFDLVLANVGQLQRAARAVAVPVFHSAYVVDLSNARAKPFHPVMENGKSAFSDVSDPLSGVCPEVGPAGDEILLVKTDASSFAEGDLGFMLSARGIEWVIVAGVWTEACIAATIKDAIALGLRVLLVKDACGSGSDAMHQTAVLNIANRLYGGAVTDTQGALRLIAGVAVDTWMVDGSVPLRFTYDNALALYGAL